MRSKAIYAVIFISAIMATSAICQEGDSPILEGPYLGQDPPGMIPKLFAPGIISSDINEHSPAAFSPDGKEVFWAVTDGETMTIKYMKQENNRWSAPQVASFAHNLECSSPVFSIDGRKLFFTTQDRSKNWEITLWYVEKTSNGWSERKRVDSIINTGDLGYQVSLTEDGTLYFGSGREGGFGEQDIYRSGRVNGKYVAPENLGSSINSECNEASVYVAPDESYILFTRMKRDNGKPGINFFASFRTKGGSWTQAVDISEKLNSKSSAFWIGGSPDGKYLFFVKKTRGTPSDMYWISSKILDDFKQDDSE